MANLPRVGVEAVIEGMAKFEADAKKIDKSVVSTGTALETMATKAAAAGLKFDEASGRWRRATGQFASDAELAAAGIKKVGDEAGHTDRKFGGLGLSVGNLIPSFSGLGSIAGQMGSVLLSLGQTILKLGLIAGGAALAGVTAFAAGLATFAVGGIKQAVDLDQQVANIAATMGATKETAGALKEELKGLALDLSLNPNLTVDVTQAGQAIEVLAANGALATDEFGKLTQASKDLAVQTVALANATGADFTTAATIATDAMALFGLETDQMGKAVDGAAGIMNASKFSAQDYQLALSNAGGIAAEMGISIEDFNTVLAGTASNFASGSDAGTSFKTLMQRLANPTDEVKAAMEQYGISLFDANGEMRSMADIAQDLNQVFNGTVTVTSQVGGATKEQAKAAEQASAKIGDLTRDIGENRDKLKLMTDVYQESLKFYDAGEPKMRAQALAIQRLTNDITDQEEKLAGYNSAITAVSGAQARTVTSTQELTEAQKAQLAATLGGADGSRILLGLADLTADEFNALSESVNRTGQGLEAAALRVDTVKGAMDIFKGVLQAIQIQVGDQFLPLFKQLAVNFTQFATEIGPQVVAFFGQVSDSIGQIIARGQELFAIFQAEGTGGLLTALGIGPDGIALFGKVSTLITDIATSISGMLMPTLSSLASGGIMNSINMGLTFLNQHFEEIKGALLGLGVVVAGGVFVALVTAIAGLATPVAALAAGAALLGAAWAGNWFGIRDSTMAAWAVIQPALAQLVTWLQVNIPVAITATTDLWNTYFLPGIMAVGNFIDTILVPAFTTMWTWLNTNIPVAIQVLSDIWNDTLLPALRVGYENFSLVLSLLESIGEFVNAILNKALEALAGIFRNILLPALIRIGSILNDTLFPVFQSIGETVDEDVSPALKDFGGNILPMVQEGIEYVSEAIKDMIAFFESMKESVQSFTLPEILTPGSPPPMAIALSDIAESADLAAKAIHGFGARTAGAGKFIDDLNMGGIARAAGTGGGQWRNFRNIIKNELGASFEQLMTSGMSAVEIMDKIKAVAHRFNFPPSFATEFATANGLIEHLNSTLEEFKTATRIENMGKMLQMGGTLSSLASNFASMLKTSSEADGGLISRIAELRDFLQSGEQRFRIFRELEGGGTSEFFIDRNRAQREYNQLLEQQRRQEAMITQQMEAQQKLSFLQSQLDLIKLGRELGGNIFAGMTFGLNASVEDLLAATNAVTEAMINQINSDLQISSPSKVMARIGQQMMAGLQGGLSSMMPVLNTQLSASVAGPISPIMAGMMGGGASTTNIHNWNLGGNTINNGMNEAEWDARVLRTIRRNL